MSNLLKASRQWATRPLDERFWGLDDLEAHLVLLRKTSENLDATLGQFKAVPNKRDLRIVGPNERSLQITNWSFGQLCRAVDAPQEYLSSLPARLACPCLNRGFNSNRDVAVNCLLQKKGEATELRAVTGTKYSRIWDLDVIRAIKPALEAGWRVPPARPATDDPRARPATKEDILEQGDFWGSIKEGNMIAPAGVYRGDRDSFIFLVNPDRRIDDGGGGLMRGVFISNSEVGKTSFRITTFLLQNVCSNHIVWGASDLQELKLIHTGRANTRFGSELVFRLRRYNDAKAIEEEKMIRAAKLFELGKDGDSVIDRLFDMKSLDLARRDLEGAWKMAVKWEETAAHSAHDGLGLRPRADPLEPDLRFCGRAEHTRRSWRQDSRPCRLVGRNPQSKVSNQ